MDNYKVVRRDRLEGDTYIELRYDPERASYDLWMLDEGEPVPLGEDFTLWEYAQRAYEDILKGTKELLKMASTPWSFGSNALE